MGAVEMAAVARVEPPALERRLGLDRLLPVAGEDVIRAGQHLALLVDGDLHPQRRARRPG